MSAETYKAGLTKADEMELVLYELLLKAAVVTRMLEIEAPDYDGPRVYTQPNQNSRGQYCFRLETGDLPL